jgi:DNA-binding transcriptional MerR regulator
MGTHHPIRKQVAAEPVVIPDRLYFRIGDVAKLCGVQPYVLRFWETEFPQLKPNKGGTGQRLYRRKDVEMALRIKSLLYEQGYTIPGARLLLKSPAAAETQAAPPEPDAPEPLSRASDHTGEELRRRAHLADLREDLHELAELLRAPLVGSPSATGLPGSREHVPSQPSAATSPAHGPIPFRPQLVVQTIEPSEPNPTPHTDVETAFDPAIFDIAAPNTTATPTPARLTKLARVAPREEQEPALPLFQGDLFGGNE